jgi:hypothetical protein
MLLDLKSKSVYNEECPWLKMAHTTRSKSQNLRKLLLGTFQFTDQSVRCFVTGKTSTPNHQITLAHMLPDSCPDRIFRKLLLPLDLKNSTTGLFDPSFPDFMFLDTSIEIAFDSMKLSFIPEDILNPNSFVLKVWDDECLDQPVSIGDETDQASDVMKFGKVRSCIRDYVGSKVTIPSGFRVPRRILSYHTLCCYLHNKYYSKKIPMDAEEPMEFSSQYAGNDMVRRELASLFQTAMAEEISIDDDIDVEVQTRTWTRTHQQLAQNEVKTRKCTCVIM